ncbi:MAG: ATP-binding protein [Verrucomicrobia bacterium]|nr:ATP-binding protein [Verrucomicrobiota bacterium]
MTIRTRLTLWYAAIMFVSLLAMGVMTYVQFAPEPHPNPNPRKLEADKEDFREGLRNILWCGVPAVLLALAGGWWLMRKSLAPVAALTQAAGQINEHNLAEQLPRTGNGDEMDRLTEVFNAMTERLDRSFLRIREFTLHASHELKTPLTVMHGELETALQDEALPAAQRERLESELDEVQRLTKIVDGLTLLTKADAGQIALAREAVRLDELVREAFADAQSLARPHGLQVELKACDEATVSGDRHRLRQLLLNLTDNAIKYNVPNGAVSIALRRQEDAVELTITNTGPGIAPEVLSRVFDPFFRGDPSHSNAVEGCGLGLSIARWIAQAHGGELRLASTPGKETVASLRLPMARSK